MFRINNITCLFETLYISQYYMFIMTTVSCCDALTMSSMEQHIHMNITRLFETLYISQYYMQHLSLVATRYELV